MKNNNFWEFTNRSKEYGKEQVEWFTNELVKQKTEGNIKREMKKVGVSNIT